MIKVVFDCNVFLQAVGKGGNHAYGCLQLVSKEHARLLMSQACLEEIIEVLNRPELRALLPGLTEESVTHLHAWLLDFAEFITPVPSVFKHDVDPKDEPYINLAIASGTAYLISWDKHILSLRDIRSAQGAEFTKKYPNVFVLTPKELLDGFYAGLLPKPEQS